MLSTLAESLSRSRRVWLYNFRKRALLIRLYKLFFLRRS
jgi:hypothetical protein